MSTSGRQMEPGPALTVLVLGKTKIVIAFHLAEFMRGVIMFVARCTRESAVAEAKKQEGSGVHHKRKSARDGVN